MSDRQIQWEDFTANYIDNDPEIDDLDEHLLSEESDDDTPYSDGPEVRGPVMFPFNPEIITGKIVHTPWGNWSKANPFAPFNFYELKVMHLYGFNTFTQTNFAEIMDNTLGVAVWRSIDPYCVVVGKARLYEWKEVRANIEKNLLATTISDDNTLTSQVINKFKDQAYIAVIFPNGSVTAVLKSDEKFTNFASEVEKIRGTIPGLVIIEDGKVTESCSK